MSSRHFDGVNHHWIALQRERRTAARRLHQYSGGSQSGAWPRWVTELILGCGRDTVPDRQGTDQLLSRIWLEDIASAHILMVGKETRLNLQVLRQYALGHTK